jgi:hypothetical protein
MKKIIILLGLFVFTNNYLFCQEINPELIKYVDFLKIQNTSAKDYIINLWQKYDVVIICERNHGELTQYDLIYDIVNSEYFINNVGTIFTEVGTVSKQNDVLNFIKTKFTNKELKEQKLLELYRNIQWPCWEKSNFYFFLNKLNSLNYNLQNDLKINLFVSGVKDPSQREQNSKEDYLKFLENNKNNRDSLMAFNIIRVFDSIQKSNSSRKKCLVIMNYRHAFSKPINNDIDNELNITNVGGILFDNYPNNVANVYLNSLATSTIAEDTNKNIKFRDYVQTPIQKGKWDASFKIINKENIGFDFQNNPFGEDSLDIWIWSKQYKYKNLFTGFAYYLPLEKHIEAYGIDNYLSDTFIEELYNRLIIFHEVYGGEVNKDELKNDFKYNESKYETLEEFNSVINKWTNN